MSLKSNSHKNFSKRKSHKKREMSISKSGVLRNSPIRELNNLQIKKLFSKEKKEIKSILYDLKKIKEKGYSKRLMEPKEYCHFLNKELTHSQITQILSVLNLKFDNSMSIEELCSIIQKKAPYIMSSRTTNLLLYLFVENNLRVTFSLILMIPFIVQVAHNEENGINSTPIISIILALIGLTLSSILHTADLINYFGGSTFFLNLTLSAQHSMRHKIFRIIGQDTRYIS